MPFETYAMLLNLKKVLPSTKSNYVAVDRDYWISSFANHVEQVAIDEKWYLSRYPDVADALRTGIIKSAVEHYCHSGYFEHRLPYQILVDVKWYLAEYSDVESAIRQQIYRSAQEHFEEIGYREGRHAYPGFALMKRDELNDIDRANRS